MTKLTFYWIAEYNNGMCLPQFDPITGNENQYAEIDFNKLIRFGWYPFSIDLANKVSNTIADSRLHKYVLNLRPNDQLFVRRRTHIGKMGKLFIQYILGNQDFVLIIEEDGSCVVSFDKG